MSDSESSSSEETQSKLCIGIDLGTTNSVISYFNPETEQVEIIPNPLGDRITPSVVCFTESGEILVGKNAQELESDENETLISHVKRYIGKTYIDAKDSIDMLEYDVIQDHHGFPVIKVGEKRYKPEQISAQVLHYLKSYAEEYLGQKITDAVITVPAYFNESQRRATKDAATIAGLKCLRLVAEPTAACLCYGLHKSQQEKVLVYDLGGGTLDVSILDLCDGVFEVIGTSGNTELGGSDVDYMLKEFIMEKYRSTKSGSEEMSEDIPMSVIENAKKVLSNLKQTTIRLPGFKFTLTRSEFEMVIQDFIDQAMEPVDQVLEDTDTDPIDISQIVLVGGSTRIPKIQQTLKQMFGRGKPLNKSINPDEAVSYGATIQASIIQNVGSMSKDLILLDVTPLSLGIETTGGQMCKIINRNSSLPIETSKVFSTVEDNQETVEIKVFQGERQFTKDNFCLGTFMLDGLPMTPRGVPKIKVTFKLDCDGLLDVTAVDRNTGLVAGVTLKSETNLTQEEVSDLIREADLYQATDSLRRQCLEEMERFREYMYNIQRQVNLEEMEELLSESRSEINKYILEVLTWIDMNGENEGLNVEQVKNARELAEYNLRPYLQKMYSHQEEVKEILGQRDDQEVGETQEDLIADICSALEPEETDQEGGFLNG
jgi:molecular chaperone DnaK